MKYQTITAMGRGGPEMLRLVERELRPPTAGEVRIQVLAVPVGQDDVGARRGDRPFLPKTPFIPGYAVVGLVNEIGPGVTEVAVGDRVAALTNFGGYAEYLYWPADQLMPVPEELDVAKTAALLLDYLTAWGCLHDTAGVKAGDKVLVIGASGGVGTAFLQLGRVAGLKMYGLASAAKHDHVREHGGIPIDYRTEDFVEVLRQAEPGGIDYVFNGMGEEYFGRGLAVLRRGGTLVHYGAPRSFSRFLRLVGKLLLCNLLPNGKRIKGFGTHRGRIEAHRHAWQTLFRLLAERRIDPVIADRMPLMDAIAANERLESGQVAGTLLLLNPQLLDSHHGPILANTRARVEAKWAAE